MDGAAGCDVSAAANATGFVESGRAIGQSSGVKRAKADSSLRSALRVREKHCCQEADRPWCAFESAFSPGCKTPLWCLTKYGDWRYSSCVSCSCRTTRKKEAPSCH